MPKKIKIIFIIAALFLTAPLIVLADVLGETKIFFVDSSYDILQREAISATLLKISNQLYFYIDDNFWRNLFSEERDRAMSSLSNLADEFERKIYPTLTSTFGSEWRPGIDGDNRITVLIHPMKKGAGGYFYSGNEYSRYQNPKSNEREMVYLNSDYITSSLIRSYLSHEFLHLINFNQKEKIFGIEEEVWLNEARAEYVPTFLGYDAEYQGSNLQKRVNDFLKNPSNSLTDWDNASADYGVVNLFAQYLVDNYGLKILVDSLRSSKKGIDGINYALSKSGYRENFSQIFTNWTIAVLINDCSFGSKYCYNNENLKNLKLVPLSNFLPINLESTLSVNYLTKSWASNWHKIFGGGGTLIFEFEGSLNGNFKVPYLVCDYSNLCQLNFLALDQNQMGKIILKDFNTKYASLIIIPSSQEEFSNGITPNCSFAWKARVDLQNEEGAIEQLLALIASLKAEIARVQAEIDKILGRPSLSCYKLENNLYYGIENSSEVRCLQEFLKRQGDEIYPEGFITGNFLSLTKLAVIRFQEKYASEILNPLDLDKGTGYVGPNTRAKINQLSGS